jgi:hypothetical protein
MMSAKGWLTGALIVLMLVFGAGAFLAVRWVLA